jgi:hypothetical protein
MVASNTQARSGEFGELVMQGTVGVATDKSPGQVNPDVGQSGVRLRMCTDLRQVLEEASPPGSEPTAT